MSYIDFIAKKHKLPFEKTKSFWEKSKNEVGPETNDPIYWARVLAVFKRMLSECQSRL